MTILLLCVIAVLAATCWYLAKTRTTTTIDFLPWHDQCDCDCCDDDGSDSFA